MLKELLQCGSSVITEYDPISAKQLATKWSPGFRIGIGWNTNHDGWDANVTWTWYENSKSSFASADFVPLGDDELSDIPSIGNTP